jgi:hypothetical protein
LSGRGHLLGRDAARLAAYQALQHATGLKRRCSGRDAGKSFERSTIAMCRHGVANAGVL